MTFNSDNFRLAIRIQLLDTNKSFSGNFEDYFDFEMDYTAFRQENSNLILKNFTSFRLETCQKEKFNTDFPEFYDLNLNNSFCLVGHEMEIGGYWDEKEIGNFNFNMAPCGTKNSSKTNCKSLETTARLFQGSYFFTFLESQDVDSRNYAFPQKNAMKTFFQMMDFTRRKEFQFFMQNGHI